MCTFDVLGCRLGDVLSQYIDDRDYGEILELSNGAFPPEILVTHAVATWRLALDIVKMHWSSEIRSVHKNCDIIRALKIRITLLICDTTLYTFTYWKPDFFACCIFCFLEYMICMKSIQIIIKHVYSNVISWICVGMHAIIMHQKCCTKYTKFQL